MLPTPTQHTCYVLACVHDELLQLKCLMPDLLQIASAVQHSVVFLPWLVGYRQ
jgi:hypothetical protein